MNGQLKRPYKKRLQAKGWDMWGRTVTAGTKIEDNATVTVIAHYGPFRLVRDEHGNENSVGRGSLVPVKEKA